LICGFCLVKLELKTSPVVRCISGIFIREAEEKDNPVAWSRGIKLIFPEITYFISVYFLAFSMSYPALYLSYFWWGIKWSDAPHFSDEKMSCYCDKKYASIKCNKLYTNCFCASAQWGVAGGILLSSGLGSNEVQVLCYNTSLLFWVLCTVTKYFFTKVLFICTSLLFPSTFLLCNEVLRQKSRFRTKYFHFLGV